MALAMVGDSPPEPKRGAAPAAETMASILRARIMRIRFGMSVAVPISVSKWEFKAEEMDGGKRDCNFV